MNPSNQGTHVGPGSDAQLSLLGVSAAQIARKTGAKKTTVETALKVRVNDTATKALVEGWTLE